MSSTRAVGYELERALRPRWLPTAFGGQFERRPSVGFRQWLITSQVPKVLETAIENTRADMGNIQLVSGNSSHLTITAQRGFDKPFLEFFNSVSHGQAACGTALQQVRRILVPDVTKSPLFLRTPSLEILLDARVRAVQSTPLVGRSGLVVGILSTHYRSCRVPSKDDLRVIDRLARWTARVLDWAAHGNGSALAG